MLLRVVGVAHPEQFINRPVLVTIDRGEYGLSYEIAVSCANDGRRNLLHVQNDWVKVREYRLERGDLRIYGGLFDRFGGGRLYWSGIKYRW